MDLHTSGQTPKVKGLQSSLHVALFGTFGAMSLRPLSKSLGPLRMRTQTLIKR